MRKDMASFTAKNLGNFFQLLFLHTEALYLCQTYSKNVWLTRQAISESITADTPSAKIWKKGDTEFVLLRISGNTGGISSAVIPNSFLISGRNTFMCVEILNEVVNKRTFSELFLVFRQNFFPLLFEIGNFFKYLFSNFN